MYNYLINPKDNRKIKVTSKQGRYILEKYLKYLEINNSKLATSRIIHKGGAQGLAEEKRPNINVNEIIGPSSLYYFNLNINGKIKKIILMGDWHNQIPRRKFHRCTSIFYDEFILDIIDRLKEKNTCLDFFVEDRVKSSQLNSDSIAIGQYRKSLPIPEPASINLQDYEEIVVPNIPDVDTKLHVGGYQDSHYEIVHATEKHDIHTLEYIRQLFNNCSEMSYDVDSKKEGCFINNTYYNNLRYHNVCLRCLDNYGLALSGKWQWDNFIDNYKGYYNFKETFNNDNSLTILVMKYILNYDPTTPLQRNKDIKYSEIDEYIKILYMESDLPSDEVITKLKHFESMLFIIRSFINKECDKFDKNKSVKFDSYFLKGTIFDLYTDQTYISRSNALLALPMDIYFFLRLLKNFDTKYPKQKRGPKYCRNKKEIDNIIVYTGSIHTHLYEEIFLRLFNNDIEYIFKVEGNYKPGKQEETRWSNTDKYLNFSNSTINKKKLSNFNDIIEDFCSN